MKPLEFDTKLEHGNMIEIPEDISNALKNEKNLHVIIIPKSISNNKKQKWEWTHLGAESFFKDIDDADDVYNSFR